jgi:hypothetical protein
MRWMMVALSCALLACNREAPAPSPAPAPSAAASSAFTFEEAKLPDPKEWDLFRRRMVKLETENALRKLEGTAEFDPQDPRRFQVVKAPVGNILFVLEKLEPYLDGYTVTFRLGNPTSAALNGVKGQIGWGPLFDIKNVDTFALTDKPFEDATNFPPGSWTYLKVNIAPATAAQTRRISITPVFESLSLRRPGP